MMVMLQLVVTLEVHGHTCIYHLPKYLYVIYAYVEDLIKSPRAKR